MYYGTQQGIAVDLGAGKQRLILCANHHGSGSNGANSVYSDDHGATWHNGMTVGASLLLRAHRMPAQNGFASLRVRQSGRARQALSLRARRGRLYTGLAFGRWPRNGAPCLAETTATCACACVCRRAGQAGGVRLRTDVSRPHYVRVLRRPSFEE